MNPEYKTIMLCADDYGLNEGISSGIRALVEKQRLSHLSCITNFPGLSVHAQALLNLKSSVQIGLHFNLTEGVFLSKPAKCMYSLKELLLKSHLGLIRIKDIKDELNAQLDRFVESFGCMPDFIDGHQHVHQFPIVRKALLQVYKERAWEGIFIRSTHPALNLFPFHLKSLVLSITGGMIFRKRLNELFIPHNDYFSGIYDFAQERDYGALFRGWLALARPNTLIMCHPGRIDQSYIDPIAHCREVELEYLGSDTFIMDCKNAGVVVRPYSKRKYSPQI